MLPHPKYPELKKKKKSPMCGFSAIVQNNLHLE